MDTYEEIVARITEGMVRAVAEKGDEYCYPAAACFYADEEGNPACLVGHALARALPEYYRALAAYERAFGSSVDLPRLYRSRTVMTKDGKALRDLIPPSEDLYQVIRALSTAQSIQDRGDRWGFALEGYFAVLGGEDFAVD